MKNSIESRVIERYGSIAAAVERLNEIGRQQDFAREAGISINSVQKLLLAHGYEKRYVPIRQAS